MLQCTTNRRRIIRLLFPLAMLAWLGMAWVARRYAETDLAGWRTAEWFAHRGKWISFALAALGFTAVAVWRRRASFSRGLAVQVTVVCALVLGLTLWRTVPFHFFLQDENIRDAHGHLRQTAEYTCAPVSLGNLLLARRMDVGVTERELALLSGTTVEGTPLAGLIWAAEQFGLRVKTCRVMSLPELEQHGGPALVNISTLPTVRHMTLLVGFSDKGIRFIDPAYGARTISRERFLDIWYGKTLILE